MTNAPSIPHCRRARPDIGVRAGIVVLLWVLLLGQTLGLAHRAWHDPSHGSTAGGTGHASALHAEHAGHSAAHADGPFDSHREGSAECRLLDQLAHADALPTCALLAPAAFPADLHLSLPWPSAESRHSAAYLARAPPRGASTRPAAHTG